MSVIVRVGKRYTIVIPKEIRSRVKLREGDQVLVYVVGKSIIIEPLPNDPFKTLEKTLPKQYIEREAEEKAFKWLIKHARNRY